MLPVAVQWEQEASQRPGERFGMETIVEMRDIEKTFQNNIRALRKANLRLSRGEIHSIVGENAAGKTTLMNILYGMVQPDNGDIFLRGEKKSISHPGDAIRYGIGMVHQHFKLVPEFTVLENIILGSESSYMGYGWKLDYAKAESAVKAILNRIHVEIDLHERTDRLSIGIQQKVEIVRTLFKGAEIIILDEPTTVLAPNEVSGFLDFLKEMRNQGSTIIYISHRLKEIFYVSDSITVLRHGKTIKTLKTEDTSMKEISSLMIGRELKGCNHDSLEHTSCGKNIIIKLENVVVRNPVRRLEGVSFTIRESEILGIAGVEGNGQVELADTLIGLQKNSGGNIYFRDQLINNYSTYKRRNMGIHYVPDDRIQKGLSLESSINENAIMGYQRCSFINKGSYLMDWQKSYKFTEEIVQSFMVEGMNNPENKVGSLSGGNMQKLIVGREMISKPPLLILAQPTVGLDFGAQGYIHDRIRELRKMGTAFLLITEDMDELISLSNRILVLYRGSIVREFQYEDGYDEKEIGYYMTGVKGNEH